MNPFTQKIYNVTLSHEQRFVLTTLIKQEKANTEKCIDKLKNDKENDNRDAIASSLRFLNLLSAIECNLNSAQP